MNARNEATASVATSAHDKSEAMSAHNDARMSGAVCECGGVRTSQPLTWTCGD